jgi:hypothetical protein
VRRQDLDRNDPIEASVLCLVDLAHPACTQGGLDLVRSEPSTGTEGHDCYEVPGRIRTNFTAGRYSTVA